MRSLEDRIKAAEPPVPRLPAGFSSSVMGEIERRGLAIAPSAPLGLSLWTYRLLLAGALLLAMVLGNGVAYELRMNGNLEMLYFGGQFALSFLAQLPWDLMIPALAAVSLAVPLLRFAQIFRVGWIGAMAFALALTTAGGATLANSGLNEQLQTRVAQGSITWSPMARFYGHRALFQERRADVRIGRVVSRQGGQLSLLKPDGEVLTVQAPVGLPVSEGDFLRLRGRMTQERFDVQTVQRCDPRQAARYYRFPDMVQRHSRMMRQMPMPQRMGPMMRQMPGPQGMDPSMMGPGMMDPGMMEPLGSAPEF